MNPAFINIGDRVRITPPSLWAGDTGTVKRINREKSLVTDIIVRSDRNFDISAKPHEIEPAT